MIQTTQYIKILQNNTQVLKRKLYIWLLHERSNTEEKARPEYGWRGRQEGTIERNEKEQQE